ncbi:hypothetical protein GLOTRDRAFT_115285 [Gloeophyllum trabeum ATCC 11539]|uniref:Uncharacterized protein n=1 Tax=Gloeophyllum trabeum (strain ATCC 11539 / FP-39264 / Madison 617) TaxID=670483 RepID=S7QBG5_GLOTA|nr:uncharacterized protein GLOTRDRAFT_115285 [Gloeophyllum trabeum ATCC 11539]EPQ57296.1 hypothetical protein GLOTRDRAFT_115285 [Gloeophyllum trabeum ATCC 11539]
MIRRDPTCIIMTDADVQDVRDMMMKKRVVVAKMTTAKAGHRKSHSGQPYVAAEDARRQREAMSRDERLGLR